MQPMFNNIIQVGVIVHDAEATAQKYRDLLGLEDWHINYVNTSQKQGENFQIRGESSEVKAKIAWIRLGNVELELIEPQEKQGLYYEFLQQKGPGVHHIMFATPDYDAVVDRMDKNQYQTLLSGELQNTHFKLFDTEKDLGLICEIAEGDALTPDHSLGHSL